VLLLKYYQDDEIKEKDIGWACGMQDREKRNIVKLLVRNFKMKLQFGIKRRKMKKIFRCIFRK
jgi:hypothetical protein